MSKRTLGIDVGLNGAIALVVDGELVSVVDMPTVTLDRNGKAKRQVSVPELVQIVKDFGPYRCLCREGLCYGGSGSHICLSLVVLLAWSKEYSPP